MCVRCLSVCSDSLSNSPSSSNVHHHSTSSFIIIVLLILIIEPPPPPPPLQPLDRIQSFRGAILSCLSVFPLDPSSFPPPVAIPRPAPFLSGLANNFTKGGGKKAQKDRLGGWEREEAVCGVEPVTK